jgi:DnaJ-class molecular chaperone
MSQDEFLDSLETSGYDKEKEFLILKPLKTVTCTKCGGHGTERVREDSSEFMTECKHCSGTGFEAVKTCGYCFGEKKYRIIIGEEQSFRDCEFCSGNI